MSHATTFWNEACGITRVVTAPTCLKRAAHLLLVACCVVFFSAVQGGAALAVCGDGILDPGEQCDDGNLTASDGCDGSCAIELGWSCTQPGNPCTPICGDGLVRGSEECDDGNTTNCDGCSGLCRLEPPGASWCFAGGPEGGRVSGLTIDLRNPANLYGIIDGGWIKSTDGAQTWRTASEVSTPTGGGLYEPWQLSALSFQPGNSGIGLAIEGWTGAIYRTSDGGMHWTLVTSAPSYPGALAFDASNPDIVYAGNIWSTAYRDSFLQKSTDAGLTWAAMPGPIKDVCAIAIAPSAPTTVYVGTEYGTEYHGLFKTTDGGTSWSKIGIGTDDSCALAVDPAVPSRIFAGLMGLRRSEDGGSSWSTVIGLDTYIYAVVFDPTNSAITYAASSRGVLESVDSGASWNTIRNTVATGICVDPTNSAILYAATGTGVLKSLDGGNTWFEASSGIFGNTITALAGDPTNNGRVYAGTDSAGVWVADRGGTANWAPKNVGLLDVLQVGGVGRLVIDPQRPSVLYVTFSGQGGVRKSTDGGETWLPLPGLPGEGGLPWGNPIAIDPQTPSTVYVGTDALYKSVDDGITWSKVLSRVPAAIAVDPTAQGTVYVGKFGCGPELCVYKTVNGGNSWTDCGLNTVVWQIVVDATAPTTVYALNELDVYKSRDGGATWLSKIHQTNYDFAALAIDPTSSSTLYVAVPRSGILISSDAGETWTLQPTADLRTMFINALLVGSLPPTPAAEGKLGGAGALANTQGVSAGVVASQGRSTELLAGTQSGAGESGVFRANTPRCKTNRDCNDGNVCNGVEKCVNQVCLSGTALACSNLIPGGTGNTDCMSEWMAALPAPARRNNGIPKNRQECTDGDPGCDFGPAADNACVFHVRLCFNATEHRFQCTASDVAAVQLGQPRGATDMANRDALETALKGLGGSVRGTCTNRGLKRNQACSTDAECDSAPSQGNGVCGHRSVIFQPPLSAADRCTDFASVTVPLKQIRGTFRAGTKTLKLTASPSNDPVTGKKRPKDTDSLKLVCKPQL